MSPDELDRLGHALSKVVQYRYCWLASHVARAVFLQLLDAGNLQLPGGYNFSERDAQDGVPPIPIEHIIVPLEARSQPLAEADNGTKFDHQYVRSATLTSLRGSLLASVQSCLEYHKVRELVATYAPEHEEMFWFFKAARDILLHADGWMKKWDLKPSAWRGIRIENNGRRLKMKDRDVSDLLDEVIEVLARMYVSTGGRRLDYVTVNLGYGVPFIRECADRMRSEDASDGPNA